MNLYQDMFLCLKAVRFERRVAQFHENFPMLAQQKTCHCMIVMALCLGHFFLSNRYCSQTGQHKRRVMRSSQVARLPKILEASKSVRVSKRTVYRSNIGWYDRIDLAKNGFLCLSQFDFLKFQNFLFLNFVFFFRIVSVL